MYSHTTTPTSDKVLSIPYKEEISDILAWDQISEKNIKNRWHIVQRGCGTYTHEKTRTCL